MHICLGLMRTSPAAPAMHSFALVQLGKVLFHSSLVRAGRRLHPRAPRCGTVSLIEVHLRKRGPAKKNLSHYCAQIIHASWNMMFYFMIFFFFFFFFSNLGSALNGRKISQSAIMRFRRLNSGFRNKYIYFLCYHSRLKVTDTAMK